MSEVISTGSDDKVPVLDYSASRQSVDLPIKRFLVVLVFAIIGFGFGHWRAGQVRGYVGYLQFGCMGMNTNHDAAIQNMRDGQTTTIASLKAPAARAAIKRIADASLLDPNGVSLSQIENSLTGRTIPGTGIVEIEVTCEPLAANAICVAAEHYIGSLPPPSTFTVQPGSVIAKDVDRMGPAMKGLTIGATLGLLAAFLVAARNCLAASPPSA